ncbi:MAG: hypothetical protein ABSA12_14010 [Verrucomicrobiia bacterium]|jgi:hypothetical protein
MMNARKWVAVSAAIGASTIVTTFALTNPVRVFRTVVAMLTVQQGSDPLQFDYHLRDGEDLVALALGATPTSNQVFAMEIDCGSSQADLVVFDKSNSNITTIATSDSFTTVKQQAVHRLVAGTTNEERFVAHFDVVAANNLAPGGFLTVAGRLHLGTNGCPTAVLISLDPDPKDSAFGDKDVTDLEPDGSIKDTYRAGQAHFIGMLNVISTNSTESVSTNAWLVPLGHMTFRRQLDQFDDAP